ncbi:DoxX family protein [Amycolatopsis sp. NPDC059657]|uniref:DoxX family protein n=1 Tax=Amycolatopsis sp. NPDC059657 TaxID=3346899 RepID=UPI00366E9D49
MAYVIVTLIAAIANLAAAVADWSRAGFVLANSAELGISERWVPYLAVPKAAGSLGLVAGLLGFRPLGFAAAVGLILFFAGAVVVHVRARVFHNLGYSCCFLALAVGAAVLAAAG